jgi:hypothetical protein
MSHAITDTDRINRVGWGLGAFAALFGIAVLVSAPWSLPTFLPALGAAVFAFDANIQPLGARNLGGVWVLNAMLFAIVFADGQWRQLTRQLDLALTAVWVVALAWLVIGPRIYLSTPTDQAAKFWIGVVLVCVVLSMIPKITRAVRGQ